MSPEFTFRPLKMQEFRHFYPNPKASYHRFVFGVCTREQPFYRDGDLDKIDPVQPQGPFLGSYGRYVGFEYGRVYALYEDTCTTPRLN
jgi:hypothetical protein